MNLLECFEHERLKKDRQLVNITVYTERAHQQLKQTTLAIAHFGASVGNGPVWDGSIA